MKNCCVPDNVRSPPTSTFVCLLLLLCGPYTGEEEMTLTPDQQVKLDTIKKELDPKIRDHPHLSHNVVLTQFLAHQGWDVKRAKEALVEALKWDNDKRLTGPNAVSDDAYPALKERIGGSVDAVDKEGRPVIFLKVNKWEWTDAFRKQEMEKWKNTCFRMMDEVANQTLTNYDAGTGKHVRFYILLDYVWWDFQKGTTSECMVEIADIATRVELRWPRMLSHIIIINTPPSWNFILSFLKPILSKETNDALKPHGQDKGQWFPMLQTDISDEELKKLPLNDTEQNSPHTASIAKMMGMRFR